MILQDLHAMDTSTISLIIYDFTRFTYNGYIDHKLDIL